MTDVIVIGSGVIGLAISYELEKAGYEVLRIHDQKRDASAGENRIFRIFHEDPRLEEDARKSLLLWRIWEEDTGLSLIEPSGLFLKGGWSYGAGYRTKKTTYPLGSSNKKEIYALDREGGIGRIAKTIDSLEKRLRGQELIAQVELVEGGSVTLRSGEKLSADFIFVAAGANTRALLRRDSGRIMHHARFLFPYRNTNISWKELPALIDKDYSFYGVAEKRGFALGPVRDVELGFFQAKGHDEKRKRDNFISSRKEEAKLLVAQFLPGLYPEVIETIYCLRDERDSEGYELERGHKLLGITGNNLFKFAPLLGTLAVKELQKSKK